MRLTFPVLVLITAAPVTEAVAQSKWCAISNEGYSNCSFSDLSNCRASVAGTGGNCMMEAPVGLARVMVRVEVPPTLMAAGAKV